jgi:molecular chaperone GrpE
MSHQRIPPGPSTRAGQRDLGPARWKVISNLVARLVSFGREGLAPSDTVRAETSGRAEADDVHELGGRLGKLSRVQFKANAMLEAQLEQHREILSALQAAVARQADLLAELARHRESEVESARRDLLLALLPVLDGLEAALANGQGQLARLPAGGEARLTLSGWLDGLSLVQRRMADVLGRYGVDPIPAVGQLFDPTLHMAVGVDADSRAPSGTVVAEDRRGYRSPTEVLRYAEVIVSRPAESPVDASPQPPRPQGKSGEPARAPWRHLTAGRRFRVERW